MDNPLALPQSHALVPAQIAAAGADELCRVYRACVAQVVDWQDGRAAVAVLTAISNLDTGRGFEDRLDALERALDERRPPRPNGGSVRGHHARS